MKRIAIFNSALLWSETDQLQSGNIVPSCETRQIKSCFTKNVIPLTLNQAQPVLYDESWVGWGNREGKKKKKARIFFPSLFSTFSHLHSLNPLIIQGRLWHQADIKWPIIYNSLSIYAITIYIYEVIKKNSSKTCNFISTFSKKIDHRSTFKSKVLCFLK